MEAEEYARRFARQTRPVRVGLAVAGGFGLLASPVACGVCLGLPFLLQVMSKGSFHIGPNTTVVLVALVGAAVAPLLYLGTSIACFLLIPSVAQQRLDGFRLLSGLCIALAVVEALTVVGLLFVGVPEGRLGYHEILPGVGLAWLLLAVMRIGGWWAMRRGTRVVLEG